MIALESTMKSIESSRKRQAKQMEDVNGEESNENDVESIDDEENEVETSDGEGNSTASINDIEVSEDGDDAGSEKSASEDDEKPNEKCNPGWADAMQKILRMNKPKKKKTIVLSKAKKLSDVKVKEPVENIPFEIEGEDGARKKEPIPKREKSLEEEGVQPIKKKKKEAQLSIRVKPSILDRERERMLQKIATKGVVQLFNVVKQQQTEIDRKLEQVGPLERKREQVMKSIDKRAFLDVLMGGSKSIPVVDSPKCEKVEKNEDEKTDKVWSVLRDDFVMGAKLKDWDKKTTEDDNDSTSTEEMDSD